MIPTGYMAKRTKVPPGVEFADVSDAYSVSGCINENFADYIDYWKHNGYWLFDSPSIIRALAEENSISLDRTSLFYYEVFEKEFDGQTWSAFQPEASLPTNVIAPSAKTLQGYDVVTFFAGNAPECSPLSCNGLAKELAANEHCLFKTFDAAYQRLSEGVFNHAEPGPYRIFAVYSVEWP